jgi:beta propeller repeat protein
LATTFLAIGCGKEPIATPYVAEEFVVCNASEDQTWPHISGDIIVWVDYRNGQSGKYEQPENPDIYGYNIVDGSEFPICTNGSDQLNPDIDYASDAVVWQDDRNGNEDIYGYNISAETEFVICNESHDQAFPSTSENTVVWNDFRSDIDYVSYIYGYNLSSGQEFSINIFPSLKYFTSIHKNIVAWLDFRKADLIYGGGENLNLEIYACDLSSSVEFAITDDEYGQDPPGADVYGDLLVWSERYESSGIYNYDIVTYNLTTHNKSILITGHDTRMEPVLYGDIVVWTDYRSGNGDIYGYNLKTGEELAICTDPAYQQNPAVFGNTVIWEDERNGNTDIYGARLTFDNP